MVLSDGSLGHVRSVSSSDGESLTTLLEGAAQGPGRLPRHWPAAPRAATVAHLLDVDPVERVTLVVEASGRLLAAGRYEAGHGDGAAEVGFVVDDAHRGRGMGTILLEYLAAVARARGIDRFEAHVPPDNGPMLEVFARAGFVERATTGEAEVTIELLLSPTEEVQSLVEAREHHAEAASLARLLAPRSVAVVGAGRDRHGVGHQVLRNLLAGDFAGPVYPVNPHAGSVAGVLAHPRVSDIAGPVDLVVIAVPPALVPEVVRDCAAKGVYGLAVLSAGFGEVGAREAEAALRDLARHHGMRLVGPNCIGVVNTDHGLDATFAPTRPAPGRIAMQSQSGAVGIVLLERSARMGLGVSTFVSVGNKADVSGNDLLQYWEDDPNTDVVLLYLESFGNPRKFARIARRVSRRKPIVAVKSGRSPAGARAASSHTASMASPDIAVDALFRQAGVIRVDTLDELFDMALLLSAQPLPAGHGVVVLGNSGGPGILAADACTAAGLTVTALAERTQQALRAVVDPNGAVANPVDLVASATASTFEQALGIALADDSVDAAIVVATRTFAAPPAEVAEALRRVDDTTDKPIIGCLLAADLPPLIENPAAPGRGVPVFATPEPAARALARAAGYAAWRLRPPGRVAQLEDFDAERARGVVDRFLAGNPAGGWLEMSSVAELLSAAGLPVLPTFTVTGAEAAAQAAASVGFPVAMKASGPDIVHKTELGAVRLGLTSPDAVVAAYRKMGDHLGVAMTGAVVQPMAAAGVETILGVVHDPSFGPLVMFGMGGTATELLGDRAVRILPVTDLDAAELVRSLRTSALLFGYRGAPAADVAALQDTVQRMARLAGELTEIAELEVNPLVVSPDGVVAVDARARLEPAAAGPPRELRRMR